MLIVSTSSRLRLLLGCLLAGPIPSSGVLLLHLLQLKLLVALLYGLGSAAAGLESATREEDLVLLGKSQVLWRVWLFSHFKLIIN